MEIPFRSQFDSTHYAFVMAFEIQEIVGNYDGDTPSLSIYATLRRPAYGDKQQQDLYPVLLDLHGKLYRMNSPHENGAILQSIVDLPISLISPDVPQGMKLSFALSARYLQFLEEHRASQQGQDMLLQMEFWGVAAVMKRQDSTPGVPQHLQPRSGEVIRFEKVSTQTSPPQMRIARSDWVDRILPNLGYRRTALIELPLTGIPKVPEVYQQAVEALDHAQRAFVQEDYRGAVRHTRDVLEYLAKSSQGGQIASFCKENLEPFVGETKSKAIDRSFNAVRDIVNAGSHLDPQKPFAVDRATAAYVIETLALNLRYISSVLS